MRTLLATGLLAACTAGMVGCEQRGEVGEVMQDLKQAQAHSPEVAQEIRHELEEKKQEVAQLEEKLARAERGVTDEVLEEGQELKAAVQRKEDEVTDEIKEAKKAAQQHNVQAERAQAQLDATKAPDVTAKVNTETTVEPGSHDVEMQRTRNEVTVETREMDQKDQPDQKP